MSHALRQKERKHLSHDARDAIGCVPQKEDEGLKFHLKKWQGTYMTQF
jgi:hypothetical protein